MKNTGLVLVLMGVMAAGCGSSTETTSSAGTVALNIASAFSATASSLRETSLMKAILAGTFADLSLSTTGSGEGVQSLKMYFREIKICESLTLSGSGYSNPTGCVSIYTNTSDAYTGTSAPTTADRTTFSAAGTGKFYDVLSSTDRASLSQSVSVTAGSYNYGIIETHPWVKLKAQSGTLCTKSAGASEVGTTGGDGVTTYHTQVTDLTCGSGSAEETLMYITNANSNFKFLKTFTVATGDSVTLDLAFNLDKEVRSIANDTTYTAGNLRSASGNNSFYVPMIRMVPAPRKTGETTKIERYTLGSSTDAENIRVEFYYNSADTTKSIIAVMATVLSTSASTGTKANKPIYAYAAEQSGDVVTLKSWDGTTVLSMTRHVAGTATITCTGNGGGSGLEKCSGQTSASFSYAAPTILQL